MKIAPTLDGGLRIDAESASDWLLLEAVVDDAMGRGDRLAERLGRLVNDESVAQDWRDFVVPELDEAFQSDIAAVALSLENARGKSTNHVGPLRIPRDQALAWYSVLNQARIALEDLHEFTDNGADDPMELDPSARSAFFRSQFYCTIQSILLDHVM